MSHAEVTVKSHNRFLPLSDIAARFLASRVFGCTEEGEKVDKQKQKQKNKNNETFPPGQ